MYSAELETLDQLLSSDMPLSAIAGIYPSPDACRNGLLGLLRDGDVTLLAADRSEIPQWQWRELFSQQDWLEALRDYRLTITAQGAKKLS